MLLKTLINTVKVSACHADNKTVSDIVFPDMFISANSQFLLLYFYPGDFTTICTTELLAFHDKLQAFNELGVTVVGCSTNGPEVHAAWKRLPKWAGGLGTAINHSLISDVDRELCRVFDVLLPTRNVATRGWFLLDRNREVLFESRNDTKTARDVSQILATVADIRRVCSEIPKRNLTYSKDRSPRIHSRH